MNVAPISNSNLSVPNFKAVNIVQVPKKVFKDPENLKECSNTFKLALAKETGDKVNRGLFGILLSKILNKKNKTTHILERSSYYASKTMMEENNVPYSLYWLSQNTGLPIKGALDKNYHSFFVFTQDDKKGVLKSTRGAMKHILKTVREGNQLYPNDTDMQGVYTAAKIGVVLDKSLAEKTSIDNPSHTFRLKSLDDIKNIVKKLDL
jgi:hypothetical protein